MAQEKIKSAASDNKKPTPAKDNVRMVSTPYRKEIKIKQDIIVVLVAIFRTPVQLISLDSSMACRRFRDNVQNYE